MPHVVSHLHMICWLYLGALQLWLELPSTAIGYMWSVFTWEKCAYTVLAATLLLVRHELFLCLNSLLLWCCFSW